MNWSPTPLMAYFDLSTLANQVRGSTSRFQELMNERTAHIVNWVKLGDGEECDKEEI
jgi:hypothetical protein